MDPKYWIGEWERRFDQRTALLKDESDLPYWDDRAADFSEMRVSRDYEYGHKVFDILEPLIPDKAIVLDVGAGPGTFLVPFGPKVERFTAIEPAENMVFQLERNAAAAGVSNYEILKAFWQDMDLKPYHNHFDLVLISITLWMFRDIWQQIQRLEQVCKGYCCVVTGVGADPTGHGISLWEAIMGDKPKPTHSEFLHLFNLLYLNGRLPELRYFSNKAERSIQSRINQQKYYYSQYITLTPEHEAIIRDHVEKGANNGMSRETYKSVAVWWKPLSNETQPQ